MSDTKPRPQVRPLGFLVAVAATVSVAALFWFFERELLWTTGVLAAAIWTPLIVRDQEVARRRMLGVARRRDGHVGRRRRRGLGDLDGC